MSLMKWFNQPSKGKFKMREDNISHICRKQNISEFEFFCFSANTWSVSLGRVEEDFNRYLWFGEVPPYVQDIINHNNTRATLN